MPGDEQQEEQTQSTSRTIVINKLISALVTKFEEKANKLTSITGWNSTPSDTAYPSEKLVKSELDNKIPTSDKITSWNSTASDTKLPTESLVKSEIDTLTLNKEAATNKTSSWTGDTTGVKYPSEKLVKGEFDKVIYKSSTAGLVKNDGTIDTNTYLTSHQSLDSKTVTVEQQAQPETGYVSTYVVKQGGNQVGSKINIPKDFLVKSGSVETVGASGAKTAQELGAGYSNGDKYIDFVINTKGNDGTDEHIYINVKDLVEDTTYNVINNGGLELSGTNFGIATGGVATGMIADDAVTQDKIADNAVGTAQLIGGSVTTAKIDDGAITSAKIADSLSDSWLTNEDIENYITEIAETIDPTLVGN